MDKKFSYLILFLFAFLQGMAFTAVPASANFLVAIAGLNLTLFQYGALFIPLSAGAILVSLVGHTMTHLYGLRLHLILALLMNMFAMFFIAFVGDYTAFLVALFLLGIAIGATLHAIRPFISYYFPEERSASIIALFSTFALGSATSFLLFSYFHKYHKWSAYFAWIGLLFVILIPLIQLFLPSKPPVVEEIKGEDTINRGEFVLFLSIALLYGYIETTFSNFLNLYLHKDNLLTFASSNEALGLFWGLIAIGRIVTAWGNMNLTKEVLYRLSAIPILICIVLLPLVTGNSLGMTAVALAGLGCSLILPLTILFAEKRFLPVASTFSGLIIASYFLGYALSSTLASNTSLVFVFSTLSIPTLIMAALCYGVSKKTV